MKSIITAKMLGIASAATVTFLLVGSGALAIQFGGGAPTKAITLSSATASNSDFNPDETPSRIVANQQSSGGGAGPGLPYGGGGGFAAGGGDAGAGGTPGMGMPGGLPGGLPGGEGGDPKLAKPADRPNWLIDGSSDRKRIEENRNLMRTARMQVDFNNIPLSAVVQQISESLGVAVILDAKSIADQGLSPDEPITLAVSEMPINEALQVILEPLNLTYEIRESFVKVTTKDYAKKAIRYYDLAVVLNEPNVIGDITSTIMKVVDEDWAIVPGNSASISTIGSMMIVRCSEEAHQEIEKLLSELEKIQPENLFPNQNAQQAPGQGGMGGGVGGMGGGGGGFGGGAGGGFF
jgi:uncharacterized membrane protein YgcG